MVTVVSGTGTTVDVVSEATVDVSEEATDETSEAGMTDVS